MTVLAWVVIGLGASCFVAALLVAAALISNGDSD